MRAISTAYRNAIEASSSDEVTLVFLTVTHDDLATPVRLVSEDENSVSHHGGEIINYNKGGNLFLGCPFALELLTDDERPPRGRITMADPERRIGLYLLPLVDSPRIKIELVALSDYVEGVYDSNNARSPSGTPTVQYTADHLFLRNVSGDALVIEAEIASYDMVGEPWPSTRATQDLLPGLFR